jgi:uncharacterized protein
MEFPFETNPKLAAHSTRHLSMKHLAVFTTCLLLAISLASAQRLSKEAKIERLLELTNGQATLNQVFEQMKAQMAPTILASATPEQRAKALQLQTRILDLMKTRMSWEKLQPEYVKAYSETFSDAEIDGILTFYESPAGRAMQAKMPTFVSKIMTLTQAQMKDLMPEIQRITREAQQK